MSRFIYVSICEISSISFTTESKTYCLTFSDLKSKAGESIEEINKSIAKEMVRIKHRLRMRGLRRRRNKTKSIDNGDEHENDEKSVELEEELAFTEDLETVQEFVDLDKISDTDEEESTMDTSYGEPGEIPIKNEQVDQHTDDVIEFSPINNDQELKMVSEKIKTNPHYLKNLRLQIVEESQDGICSLEQIFTLGFLHDCNMSGTYGRKKLTDLVPFKSVYFYLKKHLGLSLKEIELETANELTKLKHRLSTRLSRMKVRKQRRTSSRN